MELGAEPGVDLVAHEVELGAGGGGDALEEVLGAFDPDHALGFGCVGEDGFHDVAWAELVVIARDEELGHDAAGKEAVGVVATVGADGKAEADEALDADVPAAGTQADVGAEGEAGKEDGEFEIVFEPAERGANVVLLAVAMVECAFAEADAAEVEAQDGKAKGGEDLHGVVDDLVVHGSTRRRVGVADERGVSGVRTAGVEDGFEFAVGTVEVVYRLNGLYGLDGQRRLAHGSEFTGRNGGHAAVPRVGYSGALWLSTRLR